VRLKKKTYKFQLVKVEVHAIPFEKKNDQTELFWTIPNDVLGWEIFETSQRL
jgi:hypothetical protein